jgi:uroporphyrinogen decarboxylase
MAENLLSIQIEPDFAAFRENLLRRGTPKRVHYLELYQDREIKDAVMKYFDLEQHLDPNDPFYAYQREVLIQTFLGYDVVSGALEPLLIFPESAHPVAYPVSTDTNEIAGQSRGQRTWANEHDGPIQSWEDFENYPWPDPARMDFSGLDWAEKNLPENVKVYLPPFALYEFLSSFMGYENLCYKIYDEPDLIDAMAQKFGEIRLKHVQIVCDYNCVGMLFGGDDMGFKTGLLVQKKFLLQKTFPWYKKMVAHAHSKGKPCVLHSCGKIDSLMEELIEDVGFDGRQSYEDVITPATEAKRRWGDRIAVVGGLDMDFIVRATPEEVRQRTREVLEICMPGGGFCLGVGNTVANYIPLENYLTMLDEGRRWKP